jgi:hypothetical protein
MTHGGKAALRQRRLGLGGQRKAIDAKKTRVPVITLRTGRGERPIGVAGLLDSSVEILPPSGVQAAGRAGSAKTICKSTAMSPTVRRAPRNVHDPNEGSAATAVWSQLRSGRTPRAERAGRETKPTARGDAFCDRGSDPIAWGARSARSGCRHLPVSGGRGSNPRPSAWEADALPTELPPQAGASLARAPTRFRPAPGGGWRRPRAGAHPACGRERRRRAPPCATASAWSGRTGSSPIRCCR